MTEEFEWTTADGRKYPVSMMTDSHLYNAYKHVRGLVIPKKVLANRGKFDTARLRSGFEGAKQDTMGKFQQEATRRGLGELF